MNLPSPGKPERGPDVFDWLLLVAVGLLGAVLCVVKLLDEVLR